MFASGGCLCGAVRYECANAPIMAGTCHCRDCQRHSGSAFATLMIFRKESVTFSGDPLSTFTHRGESGKQVSRCFCGTCGSAVAADYDVTPDFTVIMGGTIDDPALVRPEWTLYSASKQPWVELPPHMKTFEGGFNASK